MTVEQRSNPLVPRIREAVRNVDVPEDILFVVQPNGAVSVKYRDGYVKCVLRDWETDDNLLTWKAMVYPPAEYSWGRLFSGKGVPITGGSAEHVLKTAVMSVHLGVFDG